ncbi:unnamed protein product [Danaus chrysippus]|uniref:(African queen) hypothetical protein n=1 Tax=Danaus chrysippus TaxID=151541 RepID=A0A8J2W8H6_9NEOP|nr:unnamed protein product [Danaus chrysippus]
MDSIFNKAKWFGIPTYGGHLAVFWTIVMLALLSVIEVAALWKLARLLAKSAGLEHILSMISATGVDCPPEDYLERYILTSHGFLIHDYEYSLWLAIPIFIISKSATILWNFQDLIIILMSMGLSSRYRRLNNFVREVVESESEVLAEKKVGMENVYYYNEL